MQCETCGRNVKEGKRVRLEGTLVFTCNDCAVYGKVVEDVIPREEVKKPVRQLLSQPLVKSAAMDLPFQVLADDFPMRIHKAREKKGLKQEELAKLVNEPVSVIHRLESGKWFEPSDSLIKKLEIKLGVRLMEKTSLEPGRHGLGSAKDLTLGDVVVVRKTEK